MKKYISYQFCYSGVLWLIQVLIVLIIVVSNSRSDNFNITGISGPGSDYYSLSSNCVLPFTPPDNFLLKGGQDVLGKRNCYKQSFSNMVVRCGVKMRKNSIFLSLPFSESAPGLWTSQVHFSIVIFIFMYDVGLLKGATIEYFPIKKKRLCSHKKIKS